jgi:hypothetical protein
MQGGDEKCLQGFGRKREGKEHLEDTWVDGKIILKRYLNKRDESVDCIHLA